MALALVLLIAIFLPLVGPPGAPGAASAPAPTSTATRTRTASPTPSATLSPTPSPTVTPTASATRTPEPAPVVVEVVPVATSTPTATATSSATATASPTATATATVALFVLAGQSNMGLWDTIAAPAAPEDGRLVVAALRWTAPVAGTTPGTVRAPNGPGLAFGRAVARSGRDVGIVGCAVPGTGIREWQRGQRVYEDCVAAVRATGLPLAGLAFGQGEADTFDDDRAPQTLADGVTRRAPHTWGADFAAFVASFRADVGQPDLPVVFLRLAHTDQTGRANWPTVQAQQDAVSVAGALEVPSEPVTLADGLHDDQASWDAVGERLAAAWLAQTSTAPANSARVFSQP